MTKPKFKGKPELPEEVGATYTRDLYVPITDETKLRIGQELAGLSVELEEARDKKRAEMKEHNEAIKGLEREIHEKATVLRDGQELAPVVCRELLDFPQNKILVQRMDSEEILESRAMTEEDRQRHLPIGGQEAVQ